MSNSIYDYEGGLNYLRIFDPGFSAFNPIKGKKTRRSKKKRRNKSSKHKS